MNMINTNNTPFLYMHTANRWLGVTLVSRIYPSKLLNIDTVSSDVMIRMLASNMIDCGFEHIG